MITTKQNSTPKNPDATKRFIDVMRWVMLGLRFTPKQGVFSSKPYNPILGETFACSWSHGDGSTTSYFAEQVSHHPPISAFYMENKDHRLTFEGHLAPGSRFGGNSLVTAMNGVYTLTFLDLDGESYSVYMPTIVARGIIFGSSYIEVNDTMKIVCNKTKHESIMHFKAKSSNACEGKITHDGVVIYDMKGFINGVINITPAKKGGQNLESFKIGTGEDGFLDPKSVRPVREQALNESRRVWHKVTVAIKQKKDYTLAAEEKHKVEERQRADRKNASAEHFVPKHFVPDSKGGWVSKKRMT